MLRIKVRSGIGQYHAAGDPEGTQRDILRREVELLDANGATIAKINVPSAERIAQAFQGDPDGESLSDFAQRLNEAVSQDNAKLAQVAGVQMAGRKTRTTVKSLTETEG